jgi:hypothetical protein
MNFAKWLDELDDSCTTDIEMDICAHRVAASQIAYEKGFTPSQFRLGVSNKGESPLATETPNLT